MVSPVGTGLVYIGTSSRLSYGLGRNGYFPKIISRVSGRGVPFVSICIAFVIGLLTFLPFPSWAGLVGLVTSATVIMYAMAPLSLAGLRKQDPDRPRAYRLPAAGVLCPIAFICADFIVYFSGFSTLCWLYVLIALGFILFGIYQATLPAERRTIIDWRASYWILPWLAGLLLISWQGRYDGHDGVRPQPHCHSAAAELDRPSCPGRVQPGDLLLGRVQHHVARQGAGSGGRGRAGGAVVRGAGGG